MNIEFYKQQADAFLDYASKNSDKDFLSTFNEWAFSKDFSGEDRITIWKIIRSVPEAKRKKTAKYTGDEYARLSAVLEIIFQNDLVRFDKLLNKDKKNKNDKDDGEKINLESTV